METGVPFQITILGSIIHGYIIAVLVLKAVNDLLEVVSHPCCNQTSKIVFLASHT